ncbi:telomerase protein component 1 [Erpetoichthys calabaricus]|uniref:telomerase protein component 1 n=1 Tax=Erpetoichthys calabaricus TaxID=27687 RepID=UPI0022343EA9|nr:telomerase protein component 1 [Erpetoichthys calabaricus]
MTSTNAKTLLHLDSHTSSSKICCTENKVLKQTAHPPCSTLNLSQDAALSFSTLFRPSPLTSVKQSGFHKEELTSSSWNCSSLKPGTDTNEVSTSFASEVSEVKRNKYKKIKLSQSKSFKHLEQVSEEMPAYEIWEKVEEDEEESFLTFSDQEESGQMEAKLIDKKILFLTRIYGSLVKLDSDFDELEPLATEIAENDPEFILKAALYTRQELNIPLIANYLIAFAAKLHSTRPHLRRYFSATVQLPSDWVEVKRLYCKSNIPSCLKKALTEKFKEFSESQLSKYCQRYKRKKSREDSEYENALPEYIKTMNWSKGLGIRKHTFRTLYAFMQSHTREPAEKENHLVNLKKLIQKLHIKEPVELVMSVLGRKYPNDMQSFVKSGLPGFWDSNLAGKRMKLKRPDTLEQRLGQLGNKAEVWEDLIDNNKLSFTEILGNLRHIIIKGVSEIHHERIINSLTDQKTVIDSRLFPLRFFSAYKVIVDLEKQQKKAEKPLPSRSETLTKILCEIHKSLRSKVNKSQWTKKLQRSLYIPVIYRELKSKERQQQRTRNFQLNVGLLQKYKIALEKAIHISCQYNLPLLSGKCFIFINYYCHMESPCKQATDLCFPSYSCKGRVKIKHVAMLLALMLASASENVKLFIIDDKNCQELKLHEGIVLGNMEYVLQQWESFPESQEKVRTSDLFFDLIAQGVKVETMIMMFGSYPQIYWEYPFYQYRRRMNPSTLLIHLSFEDPETASVTDKACISLYGFNDQILKFIDERASPRMLERVDKISEADNIPPFQGTTNRLPGVIEECFIPSVPKISWRSIRVFISSTFRDMHGERDLLVQYVFPELRQRAAHHYIHVQEVDLHWGITEEDAHNSRTVERCLSEVARSHLFVGILGEQYGLVPNDISLPDLPHFQWMKTVPPGLSLTELEVMQFQEKHGSAASQKMFFYLRTPELIRSVPEQWKVDFDAEFTEARRKMEELKSQLKQSGAVITENYEAKWGGVSNGKPYTKGLEQLGNAVLYNLWESLKQFFYMDDENVDSTSKLTDQNTFKESLKHLIYGRKNLFDTVVTNIQEKARGKCFVVSGSSGEGKTTLMAAMVNEFSTSSNKMEVFDVISYFVGASKSANGIEHFLHFLIRSLKQRLGQDVSPPASYKAMLKELKLLLQSSWKSKSSPFLVIFIDDADLLQNKEGQQVLDWIPDNLPSKVTLVLSVTSDSDLHLSLSKNKNTVLFQLPSLSTLEKMEIIQSVQSFYGRKTNETFFNNKVQVLLEKKDSHSPLYLKLACEYLRSYSDCEQMEDELQRIPSTLNDLILQVLSDVEEYSKVKHVSLLIAALAVSKFGLRERDIYELLSMCNTLNKESHALSWKDITSSVRNSKSVIPMALFLHLMRALQSVFGQQCSENPDSLLYLKNGIVQEVIEKHYLKKLSLEKTAHRLLAGHLWKLSDPDGNGTFKYCDTLALAQLPFHLVYSGELYHLQSLLSNVHFICAHVQLGLLPELLQAYSLYDSVILHENPSLTSQSSLEPFKDFLHRNHSILSQEPCLFWQQAINEPSYSAVCHRAQNVLDNTSPGFHVMKWLNKPQKPRNIISKTVHFSSVPACVAVSPSGKIAVVGTNQGFLHLITAATGQEIRTIASICDGISTCVFLDEETIFSTSFSGQIEQWNVVSGCRLMHIEAHRKQITGSDISPDKKYALTVSLDMDLKVWTTNKGNLVESLSNSSPLNCVSFHPDGQLIAFGRWDRSIVIWDWLSKQIFSTLVGHITAVRTLAFMPTGDLLMSGDLNGDIRLWSVSTAVCIGSFCALNGSAELVQILDCGQLILTAGADRMVRVWSGHPGQNIGQLASSDSPALFVDISSEYIAVGLHSNGIRIHHIYSGNVIWECKDPNISVSCVIWLEQERLLLSGSSDCILRLWTLETRPNMECKCFLNDHHGPILALAKSEYFVASASDDSSVILWSMQDLKSTSCSKKPVAVLNGHSAGVTCLSFSPSGSELVTGSKDMSLIFWDIKSSPKILRSFKHCHTNWITGCVWGQQAVVTSSNDCRVCVWDPLSGKCLNEYLGHSTAVSSVGLMNEYVISSGDDGIIRVWKLTGHDITQISAHAARINHCAFSTSRWKKPSEQAHQYENRELTSEDMWLATASADGTVKFWQPLVHMNILNGHSGAVLAAAQGKESFVTVSDDQTLRIWQLPKEQIPSAVHKGAVKICSFSPSGEIMLSGNSTGELFVWHHNSLVQRLQVSKCPVNAVIFQSESKFTVACSDYTVSVWNINHCPPNNSISVNLVTSTRVSSSVICLTQGPKLLGGCADGSIVSLPDQEKCTTDWNDAPYIIGFLRKTEKKILIAVQYDKDLVLKFISFNPLKLCNINKSKEMISTGGQFWITCVASFKEFFICGDSEGYMWYKEFSKDCEWSKMKVHKDKVSALKITESVIITASYDHTVKLWNCETMKQVGLFLCKAPVSCMELNPTQDRLLACGDILGNIYFIEWTK